MRALMLLALPLFLAACDNFEEVQQADSIEAYEEYLEANPSSRWRIQAESRLEELYLERAAEQEDLSAYDAYLDRFPEGYLLDRAMKEREDFLWSWAQEQNSIEGWKKYLEEYPRAKKKRKERAQSALEVAEFLPQLEHGPILKERVNLAEDPEGPLNGWSFTMEVSNNSEEHIRFLNYEIAYLDEEGSTLTRKSWPLVARYYPVPIEEERKVPIAPGESREWWWTDGNMPDGWSGKVKVYPTSIKLGLEEEEEGRSRTSGR